jgi:hypothetical protein
MVRADLERSPPKASGANAVAVILLLAPLVAFPWREIRAGMLDGGDDATANLPGLIYSARMFLSGELLWTPDLWMGHPLLAEPEFATLYPPRLLLLLGPPVSAWAVYVLAHFLMAEITAYAYLKTIGCGRLGALFGALGYAYAGFMLGHRGHTMYLAAGAWAPLVLLLFERVITRGGRVSYLLAALSFAMLPFAGAVQLTVYLATTLVVLGAARAVFERRWSRLTMTLAALVPGVLIAAAQILPAQQFSEQLVTSVRRDYEIGVALSFNPVFFPSLFMPHNQMHAEFYSRAGVLICCAAACAIAGFKAVPPIARAWAVVAGLSLLLMLGRYVPPLAHLLHNLPVVGVLRGPVRHNFELGLALAVLGAFGFERMQSYGSIRVRRWVTAGIAIAALSALAVWLGGGIPNESGGAVLNDLGWLSALGAALFFALWLRAIDGGGGSRLMWAAVAVGPLLETAWATRDPPSYIRNFHPLPGAAAEALPAERPIRVLSVPLLRGNIDTLVGNAGLLHRGVQHLQGYSSIAYQDVSALLDLDMHGQPNFHADLAWSVLPTLFGVTHLVLPPILCGTPAQRLSGGERCARDTNAAAPSGAKLECSAFLAGTAYHHRVESELRAASRTTTGVSFGFFHSDRRANASPKAFEMFVPGGALTPEFTRQAKSVWLPPVNPIVNFVISNEGTVAVDLRNTRFLAERELTIGDVAADAGTVLENASVADGILRLAPDEQADAKAQHQLSWPAARRPAEAFLELEARAAVKSTSGQLVLDLFAENGFDPDSAQLVFGARELTPNFTLIHKSLATAGVPEVFSLRAFAEGSTPIEVRRARLLIRSDQVLSGYPVTRGPLNEGLSATGDVLHLAARGWASGRLYMPVRPIEVRLYASRQREVKDGIEFGLHAAQMPLDDFQRRHVTADELGSGPWPLKKTALVAPDARDGTLFVRGGGTAGLNVERLEIHDACELRRYRNPRPMAHGLSLYENPRAVPRAYTADQVVVADDLAQVRRTLLAFDESELGRKVVLASAAPPGLRRGTVESARFDVRRHEVVVRSDGGPTLLVTNDRFDPQWAATIDGAPAPILRANGIVRAVVVPQGLHSVRFEYVVPRAVWLGVASALLGLLLGGLVMPALHRTGRLGRLD